MGLTATNRRSPASYNGQIQCEYGGPGQTDCITGEIKRPETGPGALCWCGCGEVIPAWRKKNSKFFDVSKCHNRYWIPKLQKIVKAKQAEEAKERIASRVPTALEFANSRPDMVNWIGAAILDDIKHNRKATFRYYFEAYRRHIGGSAVMINNNWQATFRQLVVNRFPETRAYLKVRAKA